MNTKKQIARVAMVAVVLMAAALTSGLANAQAAQGTFTLPCTTYWGDSTLPAGEYTFTVRNTTLNSVSVQVHGAGSVKHTAISLTGTTGDKSSLTMRAANGVAVAKSLYIAEIGRTFNLPTSRRNKELMANATPLVIEVQKSAGE